MKYKTLIIGLGKIGMGYDMALDEEEYILSHARAISKHSDFELLAGVDDSPENRAIFEEKFKCRAYPNISNSLFENSYDLVILATPTETHFKLIQEILLHVKPRAILCEKPLSYDITESETMVRLCEESKCSLYVNYIRRSEPGVIEIKSLLDHLNPISSIKGIVWYSKGILNNGSHFLNLLLYWLGDICDIQVINRNRKFGVYDIEPDVNFEFEKGNIVFLSAKEEDYSYYSIELITSEGRLRYENGGNLQTWQSIKDNKIFAGYRNLDEHKNEIKNEMSRYQWHVINQISLDLRGLPANVCTGEEALKTMKVLEQVRTKL